MTVMIVIPGQAVPKGRPRARAGQKSWYTPKRTVEYETNVASAVKPHHRVDPPYVVEIQFYDTCLRGDIDNMAKSVLDGLQKAGLIDDSKVIALKCRLIGIPDRKNARTVVYVGAPEPGA